MSQNVYSRLARLATYPGETSCTDINLARAELRRLVRFETINADLLEALEAVQNNSELLFDWLADNDEIMALVDQIEAAIAKAKPEPKGEANRRTVQPAAKQGTVSRSAVREAVKKAKARET